MSQPTPYDRQFNFQNQQALTPVDPPPADEMDAEFNAIKLTLDELLANLAKIQRDDGALANESVARETLNSDIQLGFGAPTVWAHNTNYTKDFDTIFHESFFYSAAVTHLSDPSPLGFANDIAKWTLIADFSAAAIQGLGTMSTQNSNLVTITGGSIAGTAITVATPDADAKAAPKSYVDTSAAALTAYVDAQIAALSATLNGKLSAATGTRMLFQQTSAPVGWTKSADHNDKALRVVSGTVSSGGTFAFSTVFGKTATDGHTLTELQMPVHAHGGITGFSNPTHEHSPAANLVGRRVIDETGGAGSIVSTVSGPGVTSSGPQTSTISNPMTGGESEAHKHGIGNSGGSTSHSHNMNIVVQYMDVIVAFKA